MISSVVQNGGGIGWAVDFAAPVLGVGFWTTDLQFDGSTITFEDAHGNVLGTPFDLFKIVGEAYTGTYQFTGFTSDTANISRIVVDINNADAVNHDDFQWGTASVVPAPGAAALALIGLALVKCLKRRLA